MLVWLNPTRLLDLLRSRRLRVAGHSMQPLMLQGDLILATRRFPHNGHPKRGDVVAFHEPQTSEISVKRVCGLPNERIELVDGALFVDGEPLPEPYVSRAPSRPQPGDVTQWTTDTGEFVLLGDNRGDSQDSRTFGVVRRSQIIGRVG